MADARESDPRGPEPVSRKESTAPDPLVGRLINDRFRIVGLVARGGMGKVYRAVQAPLGREVALKVLNPNYEGDNDPEFHKRFFLEASICSKLTHPNTVTIFDYGKTDDDVYYIAMELLEGRTLHRAIKDEAPFSPERAMHVARQICRSLREAHTHGVIHRDLKPANVFLLSHGDETDVVKVLDFGLVKDLRANGEEITQTGLFMGSPKYMSPEQIRGDAVDARSDVYSLGVILYEMLTGKVPFDRSSSVNILMAHVQEDPPPFEVANPDVTVPIALGQVVMKSIGKKQDDRFGSMDEMLAALKVAAARAGLDPARGLEPAMSGDFLLGGGATGSYPPQKLHGLAQSSDSWAPPAPPLGRSSFPPGSLGTVRVHRPGRGKPYIIVAALAVAIAIGAALALAGRGWGGEPDAPDVVRDPPPEPQGGNGRQAGDEAETEVETEAETEAGTEAEAETETDTATDTATETEGGAEVEPVRRRSPRGPRPPSMDQEPPPTGRYKADPY